MIIVRATNHDKNNDVGDGNDDHDHQKRCLKKSCLQNAAGAKKNAPKLSAVGPNIPLDMTWKRLILL